jgi:sodium-dependent dicarboxylate transporter 2/3/5
MLSHVVTTIIFISIASGLVKTLGFQQGSRYAEALFLAIAWGSNMGVVTPVAAPTNLIAIGVAQSMGYRIGFLQWTIICLPVFVVALVAMFLVLRYVLRPEMPDWRQSHAFLADEVKKLGPMSRGEKISGGVFATAMALWILPDVLPLFLTGGKQNPFSLWVSQHLDWSVTAVLMAASLFLIPVDWKNRKFAMTWDEAVKGVEWGTLSLIAAALGLGNSIAHKTLGLGQFFEQSISAVVSPSSQFFFVLGMVTFTVIVGSVISNIAIIGMVGALVRAVAPAAGVHPAALLVTVAIAANMDFALPIGTPPSAMVFASGYVRIGSMVKGGTVLALLSIPLVSVLGFYMGSWVLK